MRRGITLIEVIVSFGLSAMVFTIVSSILITVINSNTRSRTQERFEQTKNDLFVELGNVVRWGEVVIVRPNSLIVDTATYELSGTRLSRNGTPLTPNGITVTSFEVEEFMTVPADPGLSPSDPKFGHSEFPGVRMTIEFRDTVNAGATDRLQLFVAQRKMDAEE